MNSRNTRRLATALCSILVCWPYFVAIANVSAGSRYFESTIVSSTLHEFFHQVAENGAVWLWGQYRIHVVNYIPSLVPVATLESAGLARAASHIGWFGFIVFLSHLALTDLFVRVAREKFLAFKSHAVWSPIASLVTLCSLTNYNYIKSTFFFTLPFCGSILMAWILLASDSTKKFVEPLFCICAVSLLCGTSTNFTTFLYSHFFATVLFATCRFIYGKNLNQRTLFKSCILISLASAPSFLLVFAVSALNPLYFGDFQSFIATSSEGMYSLRSNFTDVFSLTTDWGLFDGFRGELYYEFSPFYRRMPSIFAIYFAWTCLAIAILTGFWSRSENYAKPTAACLFLCLVLIGLPVFLSSGAWGLVVESFAAAAVFRNITKLAPYLMLFVALLLTTIICNRERRASGLFAKFSLVAFLFYAWPYWGHAEYLTRDRLEPSPTTDWEESGQFISRQLKASDKLLFLPATYNNDQYTRNGRKLLPQGVLPDLIAPRQGFRLTETFGGNAEMTEAMSGVFGPDFSKPRALGIDTVALMELIDRSNFTHLVITKHLVDDYSSEAELRLLLKQIPNSIIFQNSGIKILKIEKSTHTPDADFIRDAARGLPSRGWVSYDCKNPPSFFVSTAFFPLQLAKDIEVVCGSETKEFSNLTFVRKGKGHSYEVFAPHVLFWNLVLIAVALFAAYAVVSIFSLFRLGVDRYRHVRLS